ncbi:TauD/TfdA family dioxygenase [Bradyrhizobium sp. HKCCYLS2038]|uniref:TauD/TfdA family dioxygenase n=1 Tax=unclassified Bradyrhizobium TaxID=2631580 RepID=UPI003EBB3BFB
MALEKLETHINWRAKDVLDPATWTLTLTSADQRELHDALNHAKSKSRDLVGIGREGFPLPSLGPKLSDIASDLIDGRGFIRISKLDVERYDPDDLTLIFWGISIHIGDPWPQNRRGQVMVDITRTDAKPGDHERRSYEMGGIAMEYHTDGSDLVALFCLSGGKSGGTSCVANGVAIYNKLVETRPDLVEVLRGDFPIDFRGDQPSGGRPYYLLPVFSERKGRLFCRLLASYIRSSQRHPDAPRLTPLQNEALDAVAALASQPEYNVYMDLRPGDIQFINNYHVLHGRTAYEDDLDAGVRRHLKRLWLSTPLLKSRPPGFRRMAVAHWEERRTTVRA